MTKPTIANNKFTVVAHRGVFKYLVVHICFEKEFTSLEMLVVFPEVRSHPEIVVYTGIASNHFSILIHVVVALAMHAQ